MGGRTCSSAAAVAAATGTAAAMAAAAAASGAASPAHPAPFSKQKSAMGAAIKQTGCANLLMYGLPASVSPSGQPHKAQGTGWVPHFAHRSRPCKTEPCVDSSCCACCTIVFCMFSLRNLQTAVPSAAVSIQLHEWAASPLWWARRANLPDLSAGVGKLLLSSEAAFTLPVAAVKNAGYVMHLCNSGQMQMHNKVSERRRCNIVPLGSITETPTSGSSPT